MNIALRVDSSPDIGTGHLQRCLNLANELLSHGAQVTFLTCNLPKNINHLIGPKFKNITLDVSTCDADGSQFTHLLQKEKLHFDILIVDHYFLQPSFEVKMRSYASKLFVIEDMPTRIHDCDILLVQNEIVSGSTRYDPLVPSHCKKLLGPEYALLDPEFVQKRAILQRNYSKIKNILVFFGGVDKTNEVKKALVALSELTEHNFNIDVVIGEQNPHQAELKSLLCESNFTLHVQTTEMAKLMAKADLSIGAGGFSCFERFCLGLPTIAISVADNQTAILKELHQGQYLTYLGLHNEVTSNDIKKAVQHCLISSSEMFEMTKRDLKLVDGEGVKRVAEVILGSTLI
jgi:UDP-2,4-diacetamido-2,4,6-trideoxy-beta-L-altropyranose hydrolase